VGFVVSKSVGNAVHRNRVRRRLRHLARQRVERLPAGAVLVVRALPAAADSSYGRLGQDFDAALGRLGLSFDVSSEPSPDLARQEVDGR
jgi:ribonuclease P protein component